MECILGEMMWTKLWQERIFVIVTLRDYYYHEYAIDMRQIRELLKDDFVESMLQADRESVKRWLRHHFEQARI